MTAPRVEVTDAAASHIRELTRALPDGHGVHLAVAPFLQPSLFVGPCLAEEARVAAGAVDLWIDQASARRADGILIDLVDGPRGPELVLHNPAAPRVRSLRGEDLLGLLGSGRPVELIDVRGAEEHALVALPGSTVLDEEAADRFAALSKRTLLVFYSHIGEAGQMAAERFASAGFYNCWNLVGGIDAFASEVDRSVPRYEGGTA